MLLMAASSLARPKTRLSFCTWLCSAHILLSAVQHVPTAFGLLQNEASSMSKAGIGKLQNLSLTVQRRWNNVLADGTRQLIIEMFLGLRLKQHFPSIQFPYSEPTLLQDEADTEGTAAKAAVAWF